MKPLIALVQLLAVAVAFFTAGSLQAQDFPSYGNVRVTGPRGSISAATPIYTPGTNSTIVAPNGAVYSVYTPGHPTFSGDDGPVYYVPAFRSYYQAPGSLHYYYGSYTPLYRSYANRR